MFRISNFKMELISTLKTVAYVPAVAKVELLPPAAMLLSVNMSRP
jgi:hypothetical protein